MESEVKFKAKFKGTSRRFVSPSSVSWDELCAQLFSLYDIGADFRLKYCDDENELVLISSQEELDEALRVNKKKSGLLSLFIEDSTSQQTNDTTLLNLENQNPNQGNTKGKTSSYADLASSVAPAFSAMNARLEQCKCNDKSKHTKEPVEDTSEEQQTLASEAPTVPMHEETAPSCYVNLAEVMAKSNQQPKREGEAEPFDFESDNCNQQRIVPSFKQEPSNQHIEKWNKMENQTSRGWFVDNKGQRQPQQQHGMGKSKKNKTKKQGSCYSELASIMAPQLANLNVPVPQNNVGGQVACEGDDTDLSDTSMTVEVGSVSAYKPPPEKSGGSAIKPSDFNQQQTNQNVQHREIKKPKRSRKHGKKNGCYAQAAMDISPLFAAMNERLKEKQRQQNSQEAVPLNDDDEQLDSEESHSSSFESFVFVNSSDEQSLSIEKTTVGYSEDVPGGSQDLDEEVQDVGNGEDQNDITVVVNEALKSSMDFIVEKAVQRMQQMSLSPSSAPNEMSTSIDADETTKVLHKGITCDNCQNEIQGVRFKCCNCPDFDLCETCESKTHVHVKEHVFIKLRFQAPGIGHRHGEMVSIFKNTVYKKPHEKKQKERQRKVAKEAEKEEKRAAMKELKHALKAHEKEKREEKRERKCIMKQTRKEIKKPNPQPTDRRTTKMARVYEKLEMEYAPDVTYPDKSVVSPGEKFLKTWVIQNVGSIAWNQWIKLECFEGDIMVTPGKSHAVVPHLKPGVHGEVSVEFIAPELPGLYSSKWHLSYGLHTFGPSLCCQIEVGTPTDKETPAQYDQSALVHSAFVDSTPPVPNLVFVQDTKVQAASYLIVDDGSGSEYLSSEETPKADQGREVVTTSEGSLLSLGTQQRPELEWDAGCVYDVEVVDVEVSANGGDSQHQIIVSGSEDMTRSVYNSEDSDDENEDDSDSSLEEITVLIPPCFIPDTPLSADPIPVKVEFPKRRGGSFNSPINHSAFEPYLNLDDNEGPSSWPIMHSLDRGSSIENVSVRSSDESIKETRAPVLAPDVTNNSNDERNTSTGPAVHTPIETPVSRQPGFTRQGDFPLASRYGDARASNQSPLPTNVVSDVLSSAIDVVTNAGKAAIATVDNFINGNVQATAVYEPEDKCEVTLGRQTNTSCNDAPPPPIITHVPGNNPIGRLIEMGFGDRRLNEQLLRKHNNDIGATIDELLNQTENEWPSQRH